MPAFSTKAIVLRHANYRDNDRMLTLLSPTHGRVEALARGCRKPKSALMGASELFALGDYELFSLRGRTSVAACALEDSFYPLRLSLPRLTHATYLLNVCEAAAQPGDPAPQLFALLARALSRLAYTEMDERALTAAFLLHAAALLGYKPRLLHCVHCAARVSEPPYFDLEAGGVTCAGCRAQAQRPVRLQAAQWHWLCEVLAGGLQKTLRPPADAPFALLRAYVEARLERPLPSAKLLPRE